MVTLPGKTQILRRRPDRDWQAMFRNVRLYRLDSPWPDSEETVSRQLEDAAFEPCGPLTERSSGWIPIAPDSSANLARRVNSADLLRLRSQSRVITASIINEELDLRIADFRQRMGEPPSAREKRRMKAEARDELLPKAMLRSDRIWGFVDTREQVIGIDVAQDAAAERFVRRLRAAFGDLNIWPLAFARPVDELLTRIFLGSGPNRFSLGRECRMRDPAEAKSVVRWSDFDLNDTSIRDHVANGMRLTHLGVVYDNVMSCVVDENGVISKIRFLGVDDDIRDEAGALARQDAEFVLASGVLRNLLGDLSKALGGFA